MQVQLDIGFEQLVQLAKSLPRRQWIQLKKEVDHTSDMDKAEKNELEALLLSAPTFSGQQLDEIAKTTKAINEWRTK
jgi:hypothetical protein